MIREEDIFRKVASGEMTKEQALVQLRRLRAPKAPDAQKQDASPRKQLSQGQRILWLIFKLAPDSPAYNLPFAGEINEQTNVEALSRALNAMVQRHPILGVRFGEEDGEPYFQETHHHCPLDRIESGADEDLGKALKLEACKPFNLESGPLIRATIFFRQNKPAALLVNMHHIIFDGISTGVFLTEMNQFYKAEITGVPYQPESPAAVYSDFTSWERQWLKSGEGQAARNYWLKHLTPPLPPFALPTDKPRPKIPRFLGDTAFLSLDPNLTLAIRQLALKKRIPPFVFIMTLFKMLLKRYTQLDDIVIGTPVSGRPTANLEKTVGFFINMIALRDDLSGDPTFLDLAKQIRKTTYDGMDYGNYPQSLLIGELKKSQPDLGQGLYHIAFYYQNWGVSSEGEDTHPALHDLFTKNIPEIHQNGEFDLTLEVREAESSYHLLFKYNSDIFEASTMTRLAGHFQALARSVVETPEEPISRLNMLSDAEKQLLLHDWNNTQTTWPEPCIHQIVQTRAEQHPEKRAVIFDDTELTYAELNQKANRLAALLQGQGVGPGNLVGIFLDRSLDLLPALLGVLKAGAGYVPFDPDYPADRISYMLEDSGVVTVATESSLKDRLPSIPYVLTDGPDPEMPWLDPDSGWNDTAYVIYTSGSTGKPKGVRISHGALINFLQAMASEPGMTSEDKLLALTTICFDIAGLELFLPLLVGGEVEVLATGVSRDGLRLKARIAQSKATIIQATPATWQMLLAAEWEQKTDLKILCGGEALNPELADALTDQAGEVWNMFGPTETTIWSSVSRVEKGKKVTIGRPIANTWFFILDHQLQPVPVGVIGELFIGGQGLAEDYLNRPELTRERFIPNPFPGVGSDRIYNTGDQARYLPDGNVEYLGRKDQQIKIRGFRIEIGEIETALKKLDNVREAVVALRKDPNKRLVAFLIADDPSKPLANAPERTLEQWLPEYMIPSRFEYLENYPMTLNRKVDRKTLSTENLSQLIANHGGRVEDLPVQVVQASSGSSPLQHAVEETVRGIAAQIMDIQPQAIDRQTPIGRYGFDSLEFTTLSVKINKHYGIEINPTLFYEYATLGEIAENLVETWSQAMGKVHGEGLVAQVASSTVNFARVQAAVNLEEPIAIIGFSVLAPQSESAGAFWDNLMAGKEMVQEIPAERWDWRQFYGASSETNKTLVKWGGFVRDVDRFDSLFFGISPREAEAMDPQQRLLLETTWKAIENSGIHPADLEGTATCVFMGVSSQDYEEVARHQPGGIDVMTATSNSPAILVNRISNILDLRGPSEPVNVACASAMTAVHHGVSSLRSGESEMAIVGGVNLILSPGPFIALSLSGMLSPTGNCRPFAANADGYVRGEGVGVLLLKPLSDAEASGDVIHAVIRGSAVNHGGRVNSLTAPNPNAQADLMVRVYQKSGIDPATVGYMEASANGTAMGDPLEINAMKKAFGQLFKIQGRTAPASAWCAVSNVKPYTGHMEAASGVLGIVKVMLSMKHGVIPGNIHLDEVNPYIQTENSPFYLLQETREWPVLKSEKGENLPRRAGVNSFGFGGVNAHVILEEYESAPAAEGVGPWFFPFAARDAALLTEYVSLFRDFLAGPHEATLEQMAYTLQLGRKHHAFRFGVTATNKEALLGKLNVFLKDPTNHGMLYGQAPVLPPVSEQVPNVRPGSTESQLEELGRLWVGGVQIPWADLYPTKPRRAALPGCPFKDKRHWLGRDTVQSTAATAPVISETVVHEVAEVEAPVMDHEPHVQPAIETRAQMASYLTGLIASLLKLESLPVDGFLDDYGFDSLTGTRMVSMLEERFELSIPPSALFDCQTINELTQYMADALSLPDHVLADQAALAEADRPPQTKMEMALYLKNLITNLLKLGDEDLPLDGFLDDYGFDSLTGTRMVSMLEEQFELTIPPSALFDCQTISELASYMADALSLPDGVQADQLEEERPPRTTMEMALYLQGLISNLLKLGDVDLPLDGFLGDYGFDSLTGTRMVAMLEEQFELTIPSSAMFDCQTIDELSHYLGDRLSLQDELIKKAEPAPDQETLIEEKAAPRQPPTVFPLAEAQKAVWFLLQVDPHNYGYHLPSTLHIRGAVDTRLVKQAFELLILHNPAFRTTFRMGETEPEQVIHPEVRPFFEYRDISGLEPEEVEPYIREEAFQPFDLEQGPLLRVTLFTRTPEEHILLFVIHHIIIDGSSFGLLITELNKIHHSLQKGEPYEPPEVEAHYSEFVAWQSTMLAGEEGAAKLKFWMDKLSGELPILTLPTDFPRQKNGTYSGAVHSVSLDMENMRGLQLLSRKMRVSPFMILLTGFKILLMRHTRQTDIIVGTPVAARPHERFQNLIGFFINMVALRLDLGGNPSFSQTLQKVKKVVLESLDHDDFPYATLIQKLRIDPSDEVTPIFQAAFNLQSWFRQTERELDQAGGNVGIFGDQSGMGEMESIHETGAFDLTLEIIIGEHEAIAHFKYDPGLFKHRRIVAMADHYQNLLHAILKDPEKPIAYLPMMSDSEKEFLMGLGQKREHAEITFTQLIEKRVMENPDAPALIFDDREHDGASGAAITYTYGEMNEKVNRLAHYLISQGVGPDDKIGVCLDRSADMVIGVLAAMKSGGAYVPLDPEYPRDRVVHILEQAKPKAVITKEAHASLAAATGSELVFMDRDGEAIAKMSAANPEVLTKPSNLLYVTFTSGSTGVPKGVMIEHRRLVNVYHSWEEAYRLREIPRVHLNMASFSFDVFSGDLARSLGSGAALVVCPKTFLLEPEKLYGVLHRQKVDAAEFVPAVLRNLISWLKETGNHLGFFRLLIAGSDAWSVNEYASFKRFCSSETRLINSYGVTEATIDTTWFECPSLGFTQSPNA